MTMLSSPSKNKNKNFTTKFLEYQEQNRSILFKQKNYRISTAKYHFFHLAPKQPEPKMSNKLTAFFIFGILRLTLFLLF